MMFTKLKNSIKNFIYNHVGGYTILPFTLGVNIINKCNRACSFCHYRSPKLKPTIFLDWLYNQPNYMDVDKFEKFITRLGIFRLLIKSIGLTGKGEPLLHPDFIRFCDIMNKYKISFSITTNGDLIEYHINQLSKYKYLNHLRISIYSVKSYNKIKNITALFKTMDISFYNMTGEYIKEMPIGIKLWAEGLDGENTIPKDFNKIETCTKPFSYLSLNPDGTIVFCNSYYEIGTWNDKFINILNGKRSRYFRKQALNVKTVEKADCLNCAFNHTYDT